MLIRLAVALLALLCLPTAANAVCTVSDPPPFATTTQMSTQNSGAVSITGGCIDGTPIGENRPSTGHFTSLIVDGSVIDARAYGAVCDGVTDDSAAIQAAIDAAGAAGGGTVRLPGMVCNIGAAGIAIGNGSASAWSTYQGVVLRASDANPGIYTLFGAPGTNPTPRLVYSGSGAAVTIAGPLQGWGVQGLQIECTSDIGTTGLAVTSAHYGDVRNLTVIGCQEAIRSDVVRGFPAGINNVDSLHNSYTNIQCIIKVLHAQIYSCIHETGTDQANSDFSQVTNVTSSTSGTTSGATVYDIWLGAMDSSIYDNVHATGVQHGVGGITRAVVAFDYANGYTDLWPAGARLSSIETARGPAANVGTPSVSAKMNYWLTTKYTNGGTDPPFLDNLFIDFAKGSWTPTLKGVGTTGTATYTAQRGYYEVSGFNVTARFILVVDNISGYSGAMYVGDFPVPIEPVGSSVRGACSLGFVTGVTYDAGRSFLTMWADETVNGALLLQNGSAATDVKFVSASNFASSAIITGDCSYRRAGLAN